MVLALALALGEGSDEVDEVVPISGSRAGGLDDYRVVAEHHVDPLFHAVDGLVTWIGSSVRQSLGWTPAELAATPLADLCHPDDAESLAALLERVEAGEAARAVFRLRTKDDLFLWALLSLSPGVDGSGRPGVVGSIREINLRVQVENRLRLIAAHTSDVLYTVDPDLVITWMSSNCERILGWPPQSLVGAHLADLIEPGDQIVVSGRLHAMLAEGAEATTLSGMLVRVRTRDGRYVWTEATAEPLLDARGVPDGVVGGFVDVDELVETRHAVRQEAARLRLILDSDLDTHALLTPLEDERGRISDFLVTEINEAGCLELRCRRDDVVGRRLTSMFPGHVSAGLLSRYAEVMVTGAPLELEAYFARGFGRAGVDRYLDVRAVQIEDRLSLVWRDVTERHHTAAALAASEESYRLLAENISDVIVRYRDGDVLWVSPSVTRMLGWERADWVGHPLSRFIHPDDMQDFEHSTALVPHEAVAVQRYRMRDSHLHYHWVESHPRPYLDARGQQDGIVASLRTVDAEVAAERELDRRARYDDLTGLLSRKEMLDRISTRVGRQRRTGSETALLFCDVDRFKTINDTYGHATGDELLRELAVRIKDCLRRGDVAARVGGDEILVLLNGVRSLDDATAIAEKVRIAASAPLRLGAGEISATLSIGVALAERGESVDTLVARADEAMYGAKNAGRNQVVTIDVGRR